MHIVLQLRHALFSSRMHYTTVTDDVVGGMIGPSHGMRLTDVLMPVA